MRVPVPYQSVPLPVAAGPRIRADVPLEAIDPRAWQALAGPQPFLSHAFLAAMHATGCASAKTGWRPRYLTAWDGERLAGAMPLYEKSHSYGEYVFDWSWADAYRRHGLRYYPKLVAAVPFTPVPGPRLLAREPAVRRALLDHALAGVHAGDYSSLHVLFCTDEDARDCERAALIPRRGVQFHWSNAGYATFEEFLATLTHDKRKKIRQERRKLREAGVTFERKVGAAITRADWAFFFRCYDATYRAHHSTPYLSLSFFERIGATLPEHLMLVLGSRDGRRVCAALDVFDASTLWGRYWGAVEAVSGLHFEACYYQAIEFCIEQRIERFEGGAQGVHKLARGLMPTPTCSAHAIGDTGFAQAIAAFCARERDEVAGTVDELERSAPFRQND